MSGQGTAEIDHFTRRMTATDTRPLSRRRTGDTTRQCIGKFIAGCAGMPFAPFHSHMGMPLEQAVELLPDFLVGDRPSAGALVRRNPLPAVVAPDRPITAAALNHMNGIRPERDGSRWRLGGNPGHCVQDGEDLESIV